MRPLLAVLLTLAACGSPKNESKDPAAPPPDFSLQDATDRRWWVEKTARLLHNGQGLRDANELAQLAAGDEAAVVARLMDDLRFYDTVADFNLHFFGFKSDKLGYPKADDPFSFFRSVLQFPHAFEGARLLREGGDFLAMLTPEVRLFESPLAPIFDEETMGFRTNEAALREPLYEQTREVFAALEAIIASGTKDKQAYCGPASRVAFSSVGFSAGWPDHLNDALQAGEDRTALVAGCFGGAVIIKAKEDEGSTGDAVQEEKPFDIPADAAERLANIRHRFEQIVAYAETLDPASYLPQNEQELREIDLDALGLADNRASYSMQWFWGSLPNSSTNFDRKRANYVLERFFCDDLTPLNVVLPEDHAASGEGGHASDPGCQSCHYKLDPMAGFFRYNGIDGQDFRDSESIVFDDGAQQKVADYAAEWSDEEIGYVRSSTDRSLNDYPENREDPGLEDLFALVRRSPEVRQCVVRRMFEYFVGERQALDPGWLEELTGLFNERGFKETVTALVTSRTFKTRDPVSEECYDRAKDSATTAAPPCKIAHILERNCASCHRGEGAQGGLDLAHWLPRADGHHGFPHVRDGVEVDRAETIRVMMERMTDADPGRRMPLNKHMSAIERDALYLWLEKSL